MSVTARCTTSVNCGHVAHGKRFSADELRWQRLWLEAVQAASDYDVGSPEPRTCFPGSRSEQLGANCPLHDRN